MKFEDKTVLVTGANRGIGRALVEALLSTGVTKIYAAARNTDSLPAFGDERVAPLAIDINDPASVDAAAQSASDVDILFNNAGTAHLGSVLSAPIDSIRADIDTNFWGTLAMVRAFLPALEKSDGGGIVNVASIAGWVNMPMLGGYSVSKAALVSMTQGLRIELAPRGISVHSVNPGPIDTDMAKDLPMDKMSPEEMSKRVLASLENGEADIFPDDTAQQMHGAWRGNYRDLEQIVSDMHNAAS